MQDGTVLEMCSTILLLLTILYRVTGELDKRADCTIYDFFFLTTIKNKWKKDKGVKNYILHLFCIHFTSLLTI